MPASREKCDDVRKGKWVGEVGSGVLRVGWGEGAGGGMATESYWMIVYESLMEQGQEGEGRKGKRERRVGLESGPTENS